MRQGSACVTPALQYGSDMAMHAQRAAHSRQSGYRCSSHSVRPFQRPISAARPYCVLPHSTSTSASEVSVDAGPRRPRSRNVVVAVDDDQLSWEAVKYAVTELYREGDVLHLLHVIPKDSITLPIPHPGMASMSYAGESLDFESVLWDHAMQFIRQTMVGLADQHKAKCEVDIVRGNSRECIGASICNTAEELEAAVIVVPGWRASEGIFERFFQQDRTYGSYVAQHATRPCLVYQRQNQHPRTGGAATRG